LYHYIALIWDMDDPMARDTAGFFRSQLAQARNWACELALPGCSVYVRRTQREKWNHYVLPGDMGVILGRLFPSRLEAWSPAWDTTIGRKEAEQFTASAGSRLVEDYWGCYVAFLIDQARRRCHVIRDCSGHLPCYDIKSNGVDVLFADVEDLNSLELPPMSVNWRYLAAFIYSSQLQIRETGINEVTELLAGDRLTICKEYRSQASVWDPDRICTDNVIEDPDEAMTRMLYTTQQCIGAWASTYKSILHSLSGGFDSAVVLGCLSRAASRPSVTCINRFSEEAGGDERTFARLAATQAGVRLVERAWNSGGSSIDDRLLTAPRIVKPDVVGIFGLLDLVTRNEVAGEVRADSYWTGEGGDHIFFQMNSPIGVADYIARHGMSLHLWQVVKEAARLANVSYWSALRNGLTLARSKTDLGDINEAGLKGGGGILTAEALEQQTAGYVSHPWAEPSARVPAGKKYQIGLLAEVVNRERPRSAVEYAPALHPLLSQPLMELCLRIPLYLLTKGGRERGLARAAFRDIVCPEIIERTTKGTTTMHTLRLLHDNRRYIAALMLDGFLVRRGIVSRHALEPIVLHRRPMRAEQIFPLLASIAAEIWARRWSHGAQTAVA
jgi:asparagine synthase (glutamine-hydrolysing)